MLKSRLNQLSVGSAFYYNFDYYRVESINDEYVHCMCIIDGATCDFPARMFVFPLYSDGVDFISMSK